MDPKTHEFPGGTMEFRLDNDDEKWARRLIRYGGASGYRAELVQVDLLSVLRGRRCLKEFAYRLDGEFPTAQEALDKLKELREELGLV